MTVLAVVDPSWWQRTFFGLVVLLAVAVPLGIVLLVVRTVVLAPRSARRRWPEGAGWGGLRRVPAELLVDLQRTAEPSRGTVADVADVLVALRFGLAFVPLAVVPASTGLVVSQPGLGVFVLPAVLVIDALLVLLGAKLVPGPSQPGDRTELAAQAAAARIGVAVVLGLVGGVVVAQWGSASLPEVVRAQAHGSAFGVAGWGLPTAWVQPLAFVVACVGVFLVGLEPRGASGIGGPRGVVRRIGDELWVVAGVAWLVTCFAGGGSVPWTVSVDGVRHVVSALALISKVLFGCAVLVWARVTWPAVNPRQVRAYLLAGSVAGVVSIGATVPLRHLL
jgi:NADH:ubiquinone oxidoreductase subunit H